MLLGNDEKKEREKKEGKKKGKRTNPPVSKATL